MARCFTAAFLICLCFNIHSQPFNGEETVSRYNSAQKQLLVLNTARFINLHSQNNLDRDSVMLMACRITSLPFLTPYTDDFDNEVPLVGTNLINASKIPEAIQFLKSLDGVKRLQLLIQLATWYLHRPGTERKHLDSANHFIQDAIRLNFSIRDKNKGYECLILLGEYYRQSGNEAESKNIFLQIVHSSQLEGNKRLTASGWSHLGQLYRRIDSSGLSYLNNSLSLYQQLQLKEKEIEVLWEIASCHYTYDPELFKNDLTRILEIQQSLGYKHSLFAEYYLSYVCLQQAKYPDALTHANAAIENMKWSRISAMEGTFYMLLGVVYRGSEKNEEAFAWFKKSFENRSDETRIFWFKSLLFAGTLLSEMNRPEESLSLMLDITSEFPPVTSWEKAQVYFIKGASYGKLNNYRLADENFMAFLDVINEYPDVDPFREFEETYIKAALFYLSKSNLQAASLFVKKAMSGTSQQMNNYADKKDMLLKLDSIARNNKSTIAGRSAWRFNDYYVLFKSLADADKNTGQRKKFDDLTLAYAEEKKENDIKLLQKEKQLQQTLLLQAKHTRNWILGGVGLLLIIVVLVVYNSRLKQRTNKKLKIQRLEIEEQNVRLRHLVDEKDWLAKEIHHRVKNNLQIVMSLLNSQSAYIENDAALTAIHDSQHRVHAMSLIHQKLYNTENVSSIDMSFYIRELVSYLSDSFDTGQRIRFELDIQPLEMDVSQAVPLGLILNEAITNSIKYAFPQDRSGVISILLSNTADNHYSLVISDNGIGVPQNFNYKKDGSLGMSLMKGLSEDLEGSLSIENDNGTKIKVSFVNDSSNKHHKTLATPLVSSN